MMGVQLLSQLTCEMNQISEADANRSLTKHRKIASSFRDSQLFEVKFNGLSIFFEKKLLHFFLFPQVFQLSCTLLRTAYENRKNLNFSDESQHELLKQVR